MDNNTLASNIVEALAWPVTVLIVLALFRKELSALFGRIRKGQFGDATVEFEAAVAVVEEMVQEKRGARRAAHVPARVEDRELAEADPRGAVIRAWLRVESQARSALHRKGVIDAGAAHAPIRRSLDEFVKQSGGLVEQDLMVFRELQTLRNKSVHDQSFRPSPESIIQYMALANELSEKFKAID